MYKNLVAPRTVYTLSILLNILLILYIFSTINIDTINHFFNSDALYLASIYKDIFQEHNSISDWYLNPSPSFFPDMPLYFFLMAIFKNFVLVSLLFALIQYNIFLLLIGKLFKILSNSISLIHLAIANLFMTLFFMVTTISNDFIFTSYLINNAFHFGPVIMCVACLVFSFNFMKTYRFSNLIFLFMLATISIISDRLFIVLYSLPMLSLCIIILVKKENLLKLLWLISINILSVVIGLYLFDKIKDSNLLFIGEPNKIMDFSNINNSFNLLIDQFEKYITERNMKTIVVFLSIISFFILLFIGIKELINYYWNKGVTTISSWLLPAYIIFSVFFIIIVFWAPVINGNYTGIDTLRYNIYALHFAILNWGIIIFYLIPNNFVAIRSTAIISVGGVLFLIFLFIKNDSADGLNKLVNYYPEKVKDIDSIATVHNLKYGIGGYWDAKFITMFSKKDLRVYPVYEEMTPYYHVTNSSWFYDKEQGSHRHPLYNFVVLDGYERQLSFFVKNFGDTSQVIKTNAVEVRKVFDFKYNRTTYLPEKQ